MDEQNRNLILASVLCLLVIIVWPFLVPPPEQPVQTQQTQGEVTAPATAPAVVTSGAESATAAPVVDQRTEAARIAIETPELKGSLSLLGGRIDDLSLKSYRTELDEGAEIVKLLKSTSELNAFYADFGWAPGGNLTFDDVPTPDTLWSAETDATLTPDTPVTLTWENGNGLVFNRVISIDENFMFTVAQSVTNTADSTARLAPYSALMRHGEPTTLKNFFIIHEGAMRQTGEELNEYDYDDLQDFNADPRWGANASVTEVTENGWLGFTDHYWMAMLVPQGTQPFTSVLQYNPQRDTYRSEARLPTLDVAAGETATVEMQLFAGAKEWETIRNYENDGGIYNFIDSIDWGWFFFLTKPIFAALHWLNLFIGNMGWSIIALTLLIKALLLPLAYKSYVSMAKMKELQPEMEKLKEAAGDDKEKMQKGMIELYKKNKVNPASGCLPILMQIPIFFSLYKVIFVTIELRHAEWLGWIRDLSAPDPSSILNLFGLLPWGTPEPTSLFFIFSLGVLPIILGISMWLQQKLNPAPTDKTQAMIFAWMPWVFMFMLGSFASGLVLYWIANNLITFTQQYLIMRSQGIKPDVFGNIKSSFKRSAKSGDS
ncbi:membrane protein insertase YidC [Nereida sp. MMG025]|uniref:membrane protein insertase YidC n=1 Tax=Nereida sp. MMG025 TaxID=2909981 RepID=UPI001F00E3B8|nr:membrane protein insertase YidC [Nereida sp. MMG025]MCF6444254.1 membrane protein insertase YidC [Nereida sp. MMG025]